jgi:hypothetical protein
MSNLYINKYYDCLNKNNNYIISNQIINCKYWSTDESGCNTICKLNVLNNPSSKDCSTCVKRISLTEDEIGLIKDSVKQIIDIPVHQPKPNNEEYNEQIKKSFFEKAKSYSAAESSQFICGKVTKEVFEKRKKICMSCPRRMNPTPETEPIGWCTTCGCGAKNPRASLSNKLWMPNLQCPLKKFDKEDGDGFKVEDAVDSVKGVVNSVISLFKSEGNT